jgi:hypothetical protein
VKNKSSFSHKRDGFHPSICSFTSELFYEGRLASFDGLERQIVEATGPFAGAGLWFVPVVHEGNRSYSTEEVDRVAMIVELLTQSKIFLDRPPRPPAGPRRK